MENMNIMDYMAYCYAINVTPDQTTKGNTCYLASHPELPGCMSHGETPDEAIINLNEARKLYLKSLIEDNRPIPRPMSLTSIVWKEMGNIFEGELMQEGTISMQPSFIQSEFSPIQSLENSITEVVV